MESMTTLEDLQAAHPNTTRAPHQPLVFSPEVERRIAKDWPDVWKAMQAQKALWQRLDRNGES